MVALWDPTAPSLMPAAGWFVVIRFRVQPARFRASECAYATAWPLLLKERYSIGSATGRVPTATPHY